MKDVKVSKLLRMSIQEGTWEIERNPGEGEILPHEFKPFDERFTKSKTRGRSLVFTSQYLLIEEDAEDADAKPKVTDREFDIVTIVLFDGNTTNNFDVVRVF